MTSLNEIKEKLKKASDGLEPIIEQIGAHGEGMALSPEDAVQCEKNLRGIDNLLQEAIFALATTR